MAYVFVPVHQRILDICPGYGVREDDLRQALWPALVRLCDIAPDDEPDVVRGKVIAVFMSLIAQLPVGRRGINRQVVLAVLNIGPDEIRKKNLTARRKWVANKFGISVSTVRRVMKKNALLLEQLLAPAGRHRRLSRKDTRLVLMLWATRRHILELVREVERVLVTAVEPATRRMRRELTSGWVRRPLPAAKWQAGSELAPLATSKGAVDTAERPENQFRPPRRPEPIVIDLPLRSPDAPSRSRKLRAVA